ncbi:amidase family protein [Actinokineospora terrae]|uniref:Amidase n=1 Tax=Actinokineospora terrae TaxID=155974 RepID=A0A1H9NNZ9_9PSEU|nr:amidase family protein [Actinokineospora terrae]SER37365.1 amidase [Actinokineospora terrae]
MDELLWAGADAQVRALRDGWTTAPELLESVLRRADDLAGTLNIFRTVYAECAREEAKAAQRRIDAGERLPLLGVPVAVKDDLDVAGDFTAQGGRPQFPVAEKDSAAVALLRAAGAVIVGHTRTPERCLWPFTESKTAGATRNPWHPAHTPGGSSGGSAAAIAAGIVGAATGSDGGGSIRIPAAACGVFALKTSRGLVSTEPRPAEGWQGLSTIGPMGRRVADVGLVLDALADTRGYRAAVDTVPEPTRVALSWRTPLGVPSLAPAWRRAVLDAADTLRSLGHRVVEADPPLGARPTPQFVIRYLRGVAEDVARLPHPQWLEARTRHIAAVGSRVPDRVLRWARAAEADLHARMAGFLTHHDVILQPSWTRTPPEVGLFRSSSLITTWLGVTARIPYFPTWNVLGYPVAALPVGHDGRGLPVGVQLIAPPGSEKLLLSLSAQFEGVRPWAHRRPAL